MNPGNPQSPAPFFREAGFGPAVVCLHANASSSSQWRALMDACAPVFRVIAADSYGAGRTPAWPQGRALALRDEVALLEPVFARAGTPFSLVAHSYGAAVALIAALDRPERVRALVLYEPVLFSLIDAESPPPNDTDEFRRAFAAAAFALDAGDRDGAAECFIDFWMGPGAWVHTPGHRREAIAASVTHIRSWADACLREPTPLQAFSRLQVPVLYMVGKESPVCTRSVARLLASVLPQVELVELEGVGHMGPVTHPEIVNVEISRFLGRTLGASRPRRVA
jgi:pimeloyl-ACP methyl ester carboxylesterase